MAIEDFFLTIKEHSPRVVYLQLIILWVKHSILSLSREHGVVHGSLLRWWLPLLVFLYTTWRSVQRAPSRHKQLQVPSWTTGSLQTEFWWLVIGDPPSNLMESHLYFATWCALDRNSSLYIKFFNIQTVSVCCQTTPFSTLIHWDTCIFIL